MLDSAGSPPAPVQDQRALDAMWRGRADKIREALETVPAFARYRDQVELSITPEGLRINLLESNETPLFRVGSTYLNPEAKVMLEAIAHEVRQLPNPIVIEGHTDSRPFGIGSRMTNWELSTGRANSARRVFEGTGIESKRMLEIRGFADRELYIPLDPEDSRNRRVSITLLSEAAVEQRRQVPEEVVIPWLAH